LNRPERCILNRPGQNAVTFPVTSATARLGPTPSRPGRLEPMHRPCARPGPSSSAPSRAGSTRSGRIPQLEQGPSGPGPSGRAEPLGSGLVSWVRLRLGPPVRAGSLGSAWNRAGSLGSGRVPWVGLALDIDVKNKHALTEPEPQLHVFHPSHPLGHAWSCG
jgi:hypothetical protein